MKRILVNIVTDDFIPDYESIRSFLMNIIKLPMFDIVIEDFDDSSIDDYFDYSMDLYFYDLTLGAVICTSVSLSITTDDESKVFEFSLHDEIEHNFDHSMELLTELCEVCDINAAIKKLA